MAKKWRIFQCIHWKTKLIKNFKFGEHLCHWNIIFERISMEMKVLTSDYLLIIWIAYLSLKVRINESCTLTTRSKNCSFVRILESGMRCVVCGFSVLTHLTIFHCVVVVMGLRRIVTFLLLGRNFVLSNGIFAWLILLNSVYLFTLFECRYGWPEICLWLIYIKEWIEF